MVSLHRLWIPMSVEAWFNQIGLAPTFCDEVRRCDSDELSGVRWLFGLCSQNNCQVLFVGLSNYVLAIFIACG